MSGKSNKNRSPWAWIPTLYFAQGIPYVIVMFVTGIMFKRLGISNAQITLYLSWLSLPWVIKPLWSPFVDLLKTKRWWILIMQLLIGAGLAGVAFLIPTPFFFQATLAVFFLLAFSSATHDIAADGFYMLALDSSQQSFFVGIRSTFYRFAMVAGQGILIIIAGALETSTGLEPVNFSVKTSNSAQTEIMFEPKEDELPITDELTFTAFPQTLVLNTNNIPKDSLERVKAYALVANQRNGFVHCETEDKKVDGKISVWWKKNISNPLGKIIKENFGEKKNIQIEESNLVGNVGLVAICLTKQPQEGKDMVLNSSFRSGDKSVSIVSGERFVFNSENWDKPAYVVVQLDRKLKDEVITEFKGISGNIKLAWSITFFILAGFFISISVYHRFVLPHPASDKPSSAKTAKDILREFANTWSSFFKKDGIGVALCFMLLYRLGEAMIVRMGSLFLIDTRTAGGMGLTTGEVGFVYGTVGLLALTLGGIVGGIAASRKGLKYWLWPMALAITIPNAAYLYLSYFQPDNLMLVNIAVAIEQFGYGFGFTAYMLYLIYFADGEHKTAHYAICTGFMALGMMMPGMMAGWLQELIGYRHFFIFIMICVIPTLAIIPFLKVDKSFGIKKKQE